MSADGDPVWGCLHDDTNHPDGQGPITGDANALAQQVTIERSADRDLSNRRTLAAAHALRRHGRRITARAGRVLRRLLHIPDSPLLYQHPGTEAVSVSVPSPKTP